MINYLYGELNEHVVAAEYEGVNTPTIEMNVNNADRTISAELKPLTPESLGIPLPPDSSHRYILACEYACPIECNCSEKNRCCNCNRKVPQLKWIVFDYPNYAISSDFTLSNDEVVVNSAIDRSCKCGTKTC